MAAFFAIGAGTAACFSGSGVAWVVSGTGVCAGGSALGVCAEISAVWVEGVDSIGASVDSLGLGTCGAPPRIHGGNIAAGVRGFFFRGSSFFRRQVSFLARIAFPSQNKIALRRIFLFRKGLPPARLMSTGKDGS